MTEPMHDWVNRKHWRKSQRLKKKINSAIAKGKTVKTRGDVVPKERMFHRCTKPPQTAGSHRCRLRRELRSQRRSISVKTTRFSHTRKQRERERERERYRDTEREREREGEKERENLGSGGVVSRASGLVATVGGGGRRSAAVPGKRRRRAASSGILRLLHLLLLLSRRNNGGGGGGGSRCGHRTGSPLFCSPAGNHCHRLRQKKGHRLRFVSGVLHLKQKLGGDGVVRHGRFHPLVYHHRHEALSMPIITNGVLRERENKKNHCERE